jgi:biopolymer transport protein ExbB/TolQ
MAETISFNCASCGQSIRVSVEHVGKEGRCPKCKKSIRVPAVAEAVSPSLPTTVPASAAAAEADREVRGTEVNPWLAGLYGAAATVVLYFAVFWPLRGQYLGELMMDRTPLQYGITLVTCWGAAILVLKYLAVQREMRATDSELKFLPLDIGFEITPANVGEFLRNLANLPRSDQHSILASRIRGALKYFQYRNNVPEVQTYLNAQAELSASAVDQGYTLVRAFIWVCPILGFIGTVMGISDAVKELATTLGPTEAGTTGDLGSNMLAGMTGVTKGLSVAFDTTFVGLICVVLLMFPCEILKKIEFGMLDWVEEFSHESLLRRMSDEEGEPARDSQKMIRPAIDDAFKEHQQWLAAWQVQVGQLGQKIGADFEQALGKFQERFIKTEQMHVANVNEEQLRGQQALERAIAEQQRWLTTWQADVGKLGQKIGADLEAAIARARESLGKASAGEIDKMARARRQVEEMFATLTGNNKLLKEIIEQQKLVVEQQGRLVEQQQQWAERHATAPRRRGWSFFGRGNER